jgi:hypothetical protein
MGKATTKVIATFVAAIALAGCGETGGSAGSSGSGIRGRVVIGPTCPVQVVGEHCADKPYATDLRVIESGTGERVATTSSGGNGRFAVALPAGRYRLEARGSAALPQAAPVEVVVPPHRYATTTIRFDSGIR